MTDHHLVRTSLWSLALAAGLLILEVLRLRAGPEIVGVVVVPLAMVLILWVAFLDYQLEEAFDS